MCGRYLFLSEDNEGLKKLVEKAEKSIPSVIFEEISLFEVFPSQKAIAIVSDAESTSFKVSVMIWGYSSKNNKAVINARSETADRSPFFSSSMRCVIPCSGYYEWSRDPHRKYYFHGQEKTSYLAGLAHREKDGLHFVILTEDALAHAAVIHPRQPVLFQKADALSWCRGENYKRMLGASLKNRIYEAV